jgi:hypothetical protein
MRRPYHPPCYDHPINILWSVQGMKLLIMQSSPLFRHFLPLTFRYSPQHPVFKHPKSVSFRSVGDQVSHPYKTTGKFRIKLP